MTETDPNGLDSKTPGAKLDAGKPAVMQGVVQYFPRALRAIANLSTKGAAKYAWKGWQDVPDGINRYGNAAGRHMLDEATDGLFDDKPGGTGELHQTAATWNMLARLEMMLNELEGLEPGPEEHPEDTMELDFGDPTEGTII
jgi:hypothetical protein